MFGDTLIGRVHDGRRIDARLINNSAAIQTGREPADADLRFCLSHLGRWQPDGVSETGRRSRLDLALSRGAHGEGAFLVSASNRAGGRSGGLRLQTGFDLAGPGRQPR